ncbi:hypothetical protein ADL09_02990 [Streptomyces sp. NRRL F-7442]|nr:hypothetical protein ADL09_02990 [Streptomyces sp. NRRL F-7442]
MVQCGEQMDLAVLCLGSATLALAVDGKSARRSDSGRPQPAVREPAPDRSVQRIVVDTGQ